MKGNQLKSGVVLSYLSMFLGNAIAIVYTPIMLRLLGQSEYGLYSLVSSVVGYLGLLTFGFDSAYIRYFSRYKAQNDKESIKKLNGMFIIVFSIIGLVALIAGSGLVLNANNMFGAKLTSTEIGKSRILMAILVFNIALSFPFTVFKSNITANEQYIFKKVLNIIKTIVSPFVMIPALLMGFGSVGMVVITTLINIAIEISNLVFCYKKLNIEFCFDGLDFTLLKEIAVFSVFIFINIIVDQINWNVDKFLLGIFKGTTAVAVYGIAAQLNTYYMTFSTTISSVFVPKVNRLAVDSKNYKKLTELFAKVGRVQFLILSFVLSGIIFFGKPFISMWAGKNYVESYVILLVLIIPVTIPLTQTLAMEIQRAMNLHRFRAIVYLIIAVCNVILSIPLCKLYGGFGCAIGTAIAILIGNGIIMNIFYQKKMNLNITYFWLQIIKLFPALIVPIIAGVIIVSYINLYNVFMFVVAVIVYSVCFCYSMWLFGMNEYEKNLILEPVKKIYEKIVVRR